MHPRGVKELSHSPSKICVVIPTYNERENLPNLLQKLREGRTKDEQILFVDDSSPDGTGALVLESAAKEPWIHLLSRESKKGIGSAYLDGFKHALATFDPDAVVEMDADLQHPPSLLPKLTDALGEGADVAIASRYVKGGSSRGWDFARRTVSRGANGMARWLLGLNVRDCTSGYRAYSRRATEILIAADLPTSGFEFQVAALHALKNDAKMVEVPYTFEVRTAGKSKLKVRDILRFFVYVLRTAL